MRKAEIYLYNRFAGILIEDENGYFFLPNEMQCAIRNLIIERINRIKE